MVGWRGAGMAELKQDTGPFGLKTQVAGTKRASRSAPVTQTLAQASGLLQHYTYLRDCRSLSDSSRFFLEKVTPSQMRDRLANAKSRVSSRNGPPNTSPTRERGERYRLPNLNRPQTTPRMRDSPVGPRISAREFLIMELQTLPAWKQKYLLQKHMEMCSLDDSLELAAACGIPVHPSAQ